MVPFDRATVTRVENRVSYGTSRGGRPVTRPAAPQDIVRDDQFLLSETDSRAELVYPDGSLVRIGQNTIFSFDANTRTLELTKGTLIFNIPKGSGGGVIKTPSLTAAITGTAGKLSTNIIAIVEGSVKLRDGQTVSAGQFARVNPDGSITVGYYDPTKILDGKLVQFNGIMPGFEALEALKVKLPPDPHFFFRDYDIFDRTQNLPSSNVRFFPVIEEPSKPEEEEEPPVVIRRDPPRPTPTPIVRPNPTPSPSPSPDLFGARRSLFNFRR